MNSSNRRKPVGVVVTSEESRRLKLLAALEGKTVSSYVRDLLLKHTRMADDSFFANGVHLSEQDNHSIARG
jgi:predicted DNA-binding protein